MSKELTTIEKVWDFLKGKKTYIVGIAAVIYGVWSKDKEAVITGLGLLGLRHGLNTETNKILKKNN